MVSHIDHSTSLLVRGPASVVTYGGGGGGGSSSSEVGHRQHHRAPSSHASSRARRYNRSHGGSGSSYIPQNDFPVFSHSGDVEIVVRVASGHENRYLLHRHTLTRCSGFFEASTSNQWSRAQLVEQPDTQSWPPAAIEGPGGTLTTVHELDAGPRGGDEKAPVAATPPTVATPRKRWRYELDWGKGDDDIPMLVQKKEGSAASAPQLASTNSIFGGGRHSKSVSFLRSVANLSTTHGRPQLPPPTHTEQHVLRDYDNLFRIMYNYPPVLDGINIADAYVQCKSLLTLADQYDALAVVGPRVDHHLLQFQSRLWKQIAKYPISYMRLGYLAHSRIMFQEALVHVVGQWPTGERSLRAALPDAVLDLIEDKVDELEEAVARVEARLFRLTLTTRAGERVAPATGYLDWLAVSFFRQWLADNIAPVVGPTPPPSSVSRGQIRDARTRDTSTSSSVVSAAGGASHNRASHGGSRASHGTRSSHARALVALPPPLASLGRTYRTLGGCGAGFGTAATASYLSHDECKRFLKLTPDLYTRDNLRRFEKRIDELKCMAREVVRPLMGSGLELEVGPGRSEAAASIGYLTCTHLADRDLPWDVYD